MARGAIRGRARARRRSGPCLGRMATTCDHSGRRKNSPDPGCDRARRRRRPVGAWRRGRGGLADSDPGPRRLGGGPRADGRIPGGLGRPAALEPSRFISRTRRTRRPCEQPIVSVVILQGAPARRCFPLSVLDAKPCCRCRAHGGRCPDPRARPRRSGPTPPLSAASARTPSRDRRAPRPPGSRSSISAARRGMDAGHPARGLPAGDRVGERDRPSRRRRSHRLITPASSSSKGRPYRRPNAPGS